MLSVVLLMRFYDGSDFASTALPEHPEIILPGDLLFQDLRCGPLCDAIKAVTHGVDGANFAHIAMVTRVDDDGTVWVIEAVSAGVVENTLDDLLARSRDDAGRPPVLLGRLTPEFEPLIPEAIAHAQSFLGLPYDAIYEMESDAFYCSELIYEAFRLANDGTPLFTLEPMTFQKPGSDATFAAWVDHYDALDVPIPEGEPGLNPAGMSREPFVAIVHAYGRPDGYDGPVGAPTSFLRKQESRINRHSCEGRNPAE